jgi:AAA domain
MPTLDQHQSNDFTKMIVLGDPGSGKTGGLTSLVKEDFTLGIVDFDNGLDPLVQYIKHECPDKIGNVHYVTLRDKYKMTVDGPVIVGAARAFADGLKLMDTWPDLGSPSEWGPKHILVIDSLTMMSKACFDWREQLVTSKAGKYDQRAVYYDAQKIIEKTLANLTSESFRTNVIVLAHVQYIEDEDGIRRGYPKSVGSALSSWIGAYFNSMALCQTTTSGKRVVLTTPTPAVTLKNPKPFDMMKEYPISTGFAEFFEVLRNQPKEVPSESRSKQSTDVVQPIQRQLSGSGQATIGRPNRPMRRT